MLHFQIWMIIVIHANMDDNNKGVIILHIWMIIVYFSIQ